MFFMFFFHLRGCGAVHKSASVLHLVLSSRGGRNCDHYNKGPRDACLAESAKIVPTRGSSSSDVICCQNDSNVVRRENELQQYMYSMLFPYVPKFR